MASDTFRGAEKRRSPTAIGAGVLLAVVVVIVAFVVDTAIGWAVLILLAVCAAAAVGFGVVTGSNRSDDRPLGDTPHAHDEINPHDLPLDHPGRDEAERQSGGADGTTRGPVL